MSVQFWAFAYSTANRQTSKKCLGLPEDKFHRDASWM